MLCQRNIAIQEEHKFKVIGIISYEKRDAFLYYRYSSVLHMTERHLPVGSCSSSEVGNLTPPLLPLLPYPGFFFFTLLIGSDNL